MTGNPVMLGGDFEENYDCFIQDAIQTGCVWGIESQEGFALCPSVDNDERDVMPLWSQPEYAQAHCKDEWENHKPVPISLEEFLDDWCPGMHEDTVLIGPNWNSDLEGDEVEPLDLVEDIDEVAQA